MASTTISTPEALRLIQLFVTIPLLAFGIYMMSPWYVIMPGVTAFGDVALVSTIGIKVIGFLMFLAGVGMTWGGIKGNFTKWAKASIWLAMSLYVFLLATRLITVGVIPLTWVLYIPGIGVTAVLALSVRTR